MSYYDRIRLRKPQPSDGLIHVVRKMWDPRQNFIDAGDYWMRTRYPRIVESGWPTGGWLTPEQAEQLWGRR